jgi:hypothetical protein
MSLSEYFNQQFTKDLAKIEFEIPNYSINTDCYTRIYGRNNWENIHHDVKNIDENNRSYFFLCLFYITSIDLNMFSHFNQYYKIFRNKTAYPKFGRFGFGFHNEDLKLLFEIPIQNNLLVVDQVDLNEFIHFFSEETRTFLETNLEQVTTEDFFRALLSDKDFQIEENDEYSLYSKVIMALRELFGY